MNCTVKKLSLDQVDDVVEIVSKCLKEDFPYKKETILAYLKIFNKEFFSNIIKNKKSAVFGAYPKKELVGVIVVKADFGGVAYVEWLAVKKNFRGEGIGTKLIEELDKWALVNKFHYIYLNTETDQNINFYEKRGFRYVGIQKNSWFGEDEHLLEKNV